MPKQTSSGPASNGDPVWGTLEDFDRDVDPEGAYKQRHRGGSGHGSLGDERKGFVRLRRKGWDDLMALQRAGALTHQEVLIVVGMLTRAGYRTESMGAVLGGDGELAAALGVPRNRLLPACRSAQALDIIDPLLLPNNLRAGWRFTREAWLWLVGEEEHPPPPNAAARLGRPAPPS